MKKYFKELKLFDWKIFIALCVVALFPAVYQLVRTFLISTTIQTSAFDVIGQMEWFDLINETLQAFLIVPLYSVFNKLLKKQLSFSQNVFRLGILVFLCYFIFSLVVFIYGKYLVSLMNPNDIDLTMVNRYLQFETLAFIAGITTSFINVVLVVNRKERIMYVMLILNCLLLIISDFILIPHLGINGVAISNLCINAVMSIIAIIILFRKKLIEVCKFNKETISIIKEWVKTGLFSGFQIFIDNFIYAIMVCKMVNMVLEQGNYWNANNFIWGWLLIPITALGEVIKKDCKEEYIQLKKSNYYIITIIVVTIWIVTIPLWLEYFKYCNKLENYKEVFTITLKLFPFYIAYALTVIPDNIFIGLGKTNYNLINSLIINLGYYGIFYIFYKSGLLIMNMNTIILMFGFGMVVHLVISRIQESILRKTIHRF